MKTAHPKAQLSSDALFISPKYRATDWQKLDQQNPADWPHAVEILQDRLYGRYLQFADKCLQDDYSGFVVLSIDCLLIETIQQFIEGKKRSKNSGDMFGRFLDTPHFHPYFAPNNVREDFYGDIRCGLLHQAEAKNKWLIHRKRQKMLTTLQDNGYIIDVDRFHTAVKNRLHAYLTDLCKPERADLRANLWKKMDPICNVRIARGQLCEAATAS